MWNSFKYSSGVSASVWFLSFGRITKIDSRPKQHIPFSDFFFFWTLLTQASSSSSHGSTLTLNIDVNKLLFKRLKNGLNNTKMKFSCKHFFLAALSFLTKKRIKYNLRLKASYSTFIKNLPIWKIMNETKFFQLVSSNFTILKKK